MGRFVKEKKMNDSIWYVVLHYQVYKDTIECVDSVINNSINSKIVIVDNGSPNQSGYFLKDYYSGVERVFVIIEKENLGFAKGNNVGFQYAKNNGAEFIVQINNDTIVCDKNFEKTIVNKYEETCFAVLGPDIVSLVNGMHQNPCKDRNQNIAEVKQQIRGNDRLLFCTKYRLLWLKKIISKYHFRSVRKDANDWKEEKENAFLHGSCWVFSPIYIEKFNGICDKTFMYVEEDILNYLCKRNGLKMLYSPSLRIFHKEDSSSNAVLGKTRSKQLFICNHSKNSLNVLLELMQKGGGYANEK